MSDITASRPEVVNGHTDVICSTSICRILAVRKSTLLQIDTLIRQLADISVLTESIGGKTARDWAMKQDFRCGCWLMDKPETAMKAITRNLDREIWRDLMQRSGMLSLMDAQARDTWYRSLEYDNFPEISEANILSTFEQLHQNKDEVFERGVINVFRGLSWNYENNSPCKFGSKIIVNNLVRWDRWGFHLITGQQADRLADLERMLYLFSGKPIPDMAGALTTVKRQHRPALDLSCLPELLSRIDGYKGQPVTRLAVMLNLLVFIRSSELRYARWSEIDIDNAMWTIPAEREPLPGVKFSHRGSKMRTPHLVPLSKQAVAILTELQTWAGENGLIFTGAHDPRKPISENTVNKALRVMGYDTTQDVCGHGFRAMACSALIESGLWSRDAVERQMSHQERNGVRAAYIHKAEHLEERRLMLQWWADFLDANRERFISPFEYAKINNPLKQ